MLTQRQVTPANASPLVASLKRCGAHLAVISLIMLAAGLGSWPQLVDLGFLSGWGVLWGLLLLASLLTLQIYLVVPAGAQVAALCLTIPSLVGVGYLMFSGSEGLTIVVALMTLPAVFAVALTVSVVNPERTRQRLHRGFEILATMLVISTALKIAILGIDGRELSSRPFGHGAAITLLALACFTPKPIAVFRTWPAWACVITLGLSLSRTSWLMLGAGMAVLMWVAYERDVLRPLRLLTTGLVGAATLALAVVEVPFIQRRFTGRDGSTVTLSGRDDFWPEVIAGIPDRPIIGHGPGSSAVLVDLVTNGEQANPHNEFLRVAYDLGVVALIALLATLWLVHRSQRGQSRLNPMARAAFVLPVALLILMVFTNGLTYLNATAPAFALLGAAVGEFKRR